MYQEIVPTEGAQLKCVKSPVKGDCRDAKRTKGNKKEQKGRRAIYQGQKTDVLFANKARVRGI